MLSPKQRKCVELMVRGELTQREISAEIKITEQTISTWKKDEEFMAAYDAALRSVMSGAAAKAFRTHTSLLEARSEMVRYMTAKDILDRAGFKPEDKLDISGALPVTIVDDIENE